MACGNVTFVGKLGYLSCAILSINSEAWAPPHGILPVSSYDHAELRTDRLDLLRTPLPFKTGMIVVALCPRLMARPSWCFCREKAKRESTPYETAGALYSSKRSSDVTAVSSRSR